MSDIRDELLLARQQREMIDLLEQMSPDEQADFAQLADWIVQRPKDTELTQEMVQEAHEAIRLENIRRRLGGKVGEILPFKRPEKKD